MLKNIKFNFLNFLSTLVVVLCFVYFFWISGSKVNEANHNIGEIKTAMIAALMLVLNYHLGSSKSSAKKDDTIQAMQEAQKQQTS